MTFNKAILTLIIGTFLVTGYSCKNKRSMSEEGNGLTKGATLGKVSHKYKASGCSPVIIVPGDPEMVIIPKDKLDGKFDKDGLEIYFDYHPLKMANPPGCTTGIPAEVTNVCKK